MNAYEITFIVRPDLDDNSIDAVVDQVLARIRTANGEIVATLPWNPARRRMAYPIRDYGDGVYITVTFRVDSQALHDMETTFKLNDRILRFLIVQASEYGVKQAEQRLQQRAAAMAAPPPQPVTAPPASAGTPPAETGAVSTVLAAQEGAAAPVEQRPQAETETAPAQAAIEPEPVVASPAAPMEQPQE